MKLSSPLAFALISVSVVGCSQGKEAESADSQGGVSCASPLSEGEVSLDPDQVHAVVEANYRLLRLCYERALDTNPTLQGQIDVNLVIEADGTPSQVCSGSSTLPSSDVVACVVRTFKAFRFAEQDAQMTSIYPVTFSPY